MIALQLACLVIVVLSVGVGVARAESRAAYLRQYLLLVASAWIAEDSCIRLYGFYQYASSWWLFVDQVPLLIVLIWPCVIQSARALAGAPLLGAAVVLTDAALIEPIAVCAKLWHWTEPGLFGVPPIGILGWACFAGFALWLHERKPWLTVVLAPPLTHLALLACWWGALRWVNHEVPPVAAVVLVWGVSLGLLWRLRAVRVDRVTLLARAPGAVFFFVLLAIHGRTLPALVVYSLGFSVPYLLLSSRND